MKTKCFRPQRRWLTISVLLGYALFTEFCGLLSVANRDVFGQTRPGAAQTTTTAPAAESKTAPTASAVPAALTTVPIAFDGPEGTAPTPARSGPLLDKQALLDRQTFWDNRDWDWYRHHIPFFESPDEDLNTTYYYRWELLTKHLTYGSPNSGYSFTEFIDRPFWSGAYGAISCPAGHQLYEARWLRSPRIARDYARYWFRTPGAQPRNYSTWLADSVWALHEVHPSPDFTTDLLPDLVQHYQAWTDRHFVPSVGLFWQTGHDDGMEFNINSRQTRDILRGAPGFRPSFNSYLWADARAIARIAELAQRPEVAADFTERAQVLRDKVQAALWDERREFFLQMYRDDEQREGHQIRALTRTYETGEHAGSPHGRELIGYVPWQFNLPEPGRGYERAWKFLTDRNFFAAEFGPTTVERHDPMFLLQPTCCWWSGQSWPYATTQTLKALANLLQNYEQRYVTAEDYVDLLKTYTRSHRKAGQPYLAEALHPDTGSFDGHDNYNHSEHYFHSGFCDLVITGLVGLRPRSDEVLDVSPLAPASWDYFALDDVMYHGRRVSICWDRLGTRYGLGTGLSVLVDGQVIAKSAELRRLEVPLPPLTQPTGPTQDRSAGGTQAAGAAMPSMTVADPHGASLNFAVNNDGDYFPRWTASFTGEGASVAKMHDGNYWYLRDPPNRWHTVGSSTAQDWLAVDFGAPRKVHTVQVYLLDDGADIVPPELFTVEYWDGAQWQAIPGVHYDRTTPTGRRANTATFAPRELERLRVVFDHTVNHATGVTEIEVWGDGELPYVPPHPPAGNLAFRAPDAQFPRASASYTDRFGGRAESAIDGKIVYAPTPMNRWTSYESPHGSDWLELDWGQEQEFRRVVLHVYDDRGGVQPPTAVRLEMFQSNQWTPIDGVTGSPTPIAGSREYTLRFAPVRTPKLRIHFEHAGNARSGVTEVEVWNAD